MLSHPRVICYYFSLATSNDDAGRLNNAPHYNVPYSGDLFLANEMQVKAARSIF